MSMTQGDPWRPRKVLRRGDVGGRSNVSCSGHRRRRRSCVRTCCTFEGDPPRVDDAINKGRAGVESKDTPAGLEGATMLMLVNRETGCGQCPPRSIERSACRVG